MSIPTDLPDPPPSEDLITLAEYAAQHGASYQQVYGWVRWGHIAGERHGAAGGSAAMHPSPFSVAAAGARRSAYHPSTRRSPELRRGARLANTNPLCLPTQQDAPLKAT